MLQKECMKFYLNSFSNYLHRIVRSLFLGLAQHIFFTCSRLVGAPLNKSCNENPSMDIARRARGKNISSPLKKKRKHTKWVLVCPFKTYVKSSSNKTYVLIPTALHSDHGKHGHRPHLVTTIDHTTATDPKLKTVSS